MFTFSLPNANHSQDLVRTLRGCVSTDIEVHVCAAVNPFAYHLANLLQFHDDTGCAVAVRHIFFRPTPRREADHFKNAFTALEAGATRKLTLTDLLPL